MGSCCSCCAPAAAQRYEVNDLHDEEEGQAAVQHVPAVVPRDVTPPRPGGSIVPQKLLQRDSPEEELAVVAAPPPPPATQRLANEYARAIDKKETAYRAKILSEEFTDRSALDVQRRWWGDRILDLAAQEDLLEEQRRQHQQLTALASNVDRSGRISPTDLRAAVMVEEFIIAPAAFQSRNMLAESGTGSIRPPSVSDSLTLRLSPLKTRNSISAAGGAGGRMFSTPTGDPIDDVLSATMDDDDARPFYTPPPKLDFHAPQWDDGLSTNSPWRYGALNPFDHGVRMEMVQYLAMFSASPQRMPFQRSMIREINHDRPHSRGDVVQAGDPLLGVVLDEVDGRDVIERYRRHEGFEVGLLEAQERGIRTHMEYGRSLLQLRMDCWTLWLIRFEHHQRMVIEQERFHAVLRLWSGADKRITLRRAYENQLIAAADRAVNRGVRQADAATRASGQQRKVDKLKWDVEKSRLKKPMISAKETFVEKLRAIHAAAHHDATTGVSRARHAQLLSMHMLDSEEERWRDAVALEEKRRWSDIIDLIISLSPSLICAPDLNSILSAKQQARLIAAQLELQKLEKRLEAGQSSTSSHNTLLSIDGDVSHEHNRPTQWDIDRFAAEVAILGLYEAKRRKTMAYQETLFRAMVQDVHDEEFEVHRVHDERREAERQALEAIAAAEAHEIVCHERLRRVGRGYLWRRRIGIVLPVAEDAKFLVGEHHRFHKHTIVMENIIRGDMRHYFALLSQISFPHQAQSMVQDIEMYLWTTDCLPHVEKHCREQLEMEWHQELLRTLYEPFLVERAQVALIPKAVSEGRVAAAKSIQRAYRNHCNIVWFAENMKDVMTLAKEKRLLLHAERRLLQDRESNERDAIVADWVDTDWAAMRRDVFAESARQWNAATAINKVARSWYVRNVIIPPLLEMHLKRRLKSLRQRSNSPTIEHQQLHRGAHEKISPKMSE